MQANSQLTSNAIHQHNGYTVNEIKLYGTRTIAYCVTGPDTAKTYHESDELGQSAYNDVMAAFISLSGWTNHGKSVKKVTA